MTPFENHGMFKFLSLKKDYDLELVKEFYWNFNITKDGLECHLKDKLITFSVNNFNSHFGVPAGGNEVNTGNTYASPRFQKLDFVKTISKLIFIDRLDMVNFNINHITFEMRTLHWIASKMLYRKPRNWARADDLDLMLMWVMLGDKHNNWVTFIFIRMDHCRSTFNVSLFY